MNTVSQHLDILREKWRCVAEHKWGRWGVNVLVGLAAYISVKGLLEYGMPLKHNLLLDILASNNIEQAMFVQYAPIATAVASILLPSIGIAVIGILIFTLMFGVSTIFMSFAALITLFAFSTNKATKVMIMLMPIAIINWDLGIFLMFVAMYASDKLDRIFYAQSVPLLFTILAIPAGFFGQFKKITYASSFWAKNKEYSFVKGRPDYFVLEYIKPFLIIIGVMILISIIFSIIVKSKKFGLANMSVEKRDAIAFGGCTVLLIIALLIFDTAFKFDAPSHNYLMIAIQGILAYIATRIVYKPTIVAKEERKRADREAIERYQRENKKPLNKKKLAIGILVFLIAVGSFAVVENQKYQFWYTAQDVSESEYVGTWSFNGFYQDPNYSMNYASLKLPDVEMKVDESQYTSRDNYMGSDLEGYIELRADGTFTKERPSVAQPDQMVVNEGKWKEIPNGFCLYINNTLNYRVTKLNELGYVCAEVGLFGAGPDTGTVFMKY